MQARNPNEPRSRAFFPADAARWNGVRCEDGHRGHVESYFLKLNDREGRRALWIKATILVREGGTPRVGEAWAIAFDREGRHVAVKEQVALSSATFAAEGLDVRVCGLELTKGRVSGEVVSRARGPTEGRPSRPEGTGDQ